MQSIAMLRCGLLAIVGVVAGPAGPKVLPLQLDLLAHLQSLHTAGSTLLW